MEGLISVCSLLVLLSNLGFFSRGFTTAVLKASGKTPVLRDVFIMSRTGPETLSKTRLKNVMGIGSISEVAELHSLTILESFHCVIHVKVLMVTLQDLFMSVSPPLVVILALIDVILFLKKRASSSHLAAEDNGGVGTVFSSWSIEEKRTLEFPAFSHFHHSCAPLMCFTLHQFRTYL